jgi:thiol-disulfide isomerase/thioredoxin
MRTEIILSGEGLAPRILSEAIISSNESLRSIAATNAPPTIQGAGLGTRRGILGDPLTTGLGDCNVFNRVMSVTAIALALLAVFLARQNLQLKKQLAEQQVPAAALMPGVRLGPIQLVDADGESRPLSFSRDDERTVLLFFTPDCPACRATIPVWQELIDSLERPPRILGVNLAPPDADHGGGLVTFGLPFPVFSVEAERSEGLREISYVPATVILDSTGVVRSAWFGELDDEQRDDLRRELRGR